MLHEYGVAEVGQGSNRLGSHSRVNVGPGHVEQLVDRSTVSSTGRSTGADMGQNPHRVQSATNTDAILTQGFAKFRQTLAVATFDRRLGLAALEVTVGFELRNPLKGLTLLLLAVYLPFIGDTIDSRPAPIRSLTVGPIGDDQRTIVLDNHVRRFEG